MTQTAVGAAAPSDAPAAGTFDPYALPPEAVEAPPTRFSRIIRQIGPGLILAGAIVGTGELIQTTHLGAKAGFVLLWLVLLSCFVKVFVQIELGRHAIATGETTLQSFQRLPGPGFLFTWWWLLMMLATQAQMAAMVGSVGQSFHMALYGDGAGLGESIGLGGRPELPWAALTAVVTAVLLAVGSYKLVEKATTVMVVAFTAMTVACVALLPWTGHAFGMDELVARSSLVIALYGRSGVSSCGHNDHADLLDALEAKDTAKARALMLQHLDHIEADLDLRMMEGLALKDALAL